MPPQTHLEIRLVKVVHSGFCARPHGAQPHDIETETPQIVHAPVLQHDGLVPRESLLHIVHAAQDGDPTVLVQEPVAIWINLDQSRDVNMTQNSHDKG